MLAAHSKTAETPPQPLDLRYSSQTIAGSPKPALAGVTPVYKVVRTSRLYEQIVQQIEASVLNGTLKPGDQLPAERELAQRLGVSRTAVREAVKALREKGLVEAYSGRGTFVTDGTTQAARQSFDLMVKLGQQEGSPHLSELRLILEPGIAALAAERVKREDLQALREAVAVMERAQKDPEAYIEADLDFHLALAEAAANLQRGRRPATRSISSQANSGGHGTGRCGTSAQRHARAPRAGASGFAGSPEQGDRKASSAENQSYLSWGDRSHPHVAVMFPAKVFHNSISQISRRSRRNGETWIHRFGSDGQPDGEPAA